MGNEKGKQVLQWHPAFFAGIQIEFAEEADDLIFENEHQLGTKPMEIDVLIIKKNSDRKLQKNIGKIFRKHNIVEYKSPEDYLSIDDYYKVCGYACFYKSDVAKVDSIKIADVTVSFVCIGYPRRLLGHLKRQRGLQIRKQEQGIYYVCGEIFPVQIIITSELSPEDNLWLKNLTNDLQSKKEIEGLMAEYQKHRHDNLYRSVMDIIIRANDEKFEEEKNMCEAIIDLFRDEWDEGMKKAKEEAIQEGLRQGREEGIQQGREEGIQQGRQEGIQQGIQQGIQWLIETCKSLGASKEVTKNMLLEKMSLKQEQAEEYLVLYW